jgi:hypothetical protein
MAVGTKLILASQREPVSNRLPESLRQESGSDVKGEQLPLRCMSS